VRKIYRSQRTSRNETRTLSGARMAYGPMMAQEKDITMANWIPGELRKVTTCGCLFLLASEAVDLHETQLKSQPAPYVVPPSTAANYDNVHVDLEDYPQNPWGAQQLSASDSSSGAMLAGGNSFVDSFHRSLGPRGFYLVVNADLAATKSESK
jgi:hypothetical protein